MTRPVLDIALFLLGPAVMAVGFALTVQQSEPVATHFYLVAWCGLIFSLDRVIRRVEGRSLIARCRLPGFGLVVLWSAVVWFFFELLNFRLQNWYYVFVSDVAAVRLVGTFLAFGTVFPGIFWIDRVLSLCGLDRPLRGPALTLTSRRLRLLQAAGVLFLLLPLLLPQYCFALVWGSVFLVVAPYNYRLGIDGLLRQLQRGDYGPAVRLLSAGMVAGLCWELFNYWARAKWIYTVPFFDELKLFEMPLAGFLGFPPFAIECACIYRLLVWHRLAPALGIFAQQSPTPASRVRLPLAVTLGVLFGLAVFAGVDRWTVTSTTPRVDRVEPLDGDLRRRLDDAGITYLTQLRGPGSAARWETLSTQLEVDDRRRLEQLTTLYLHQGIGTEHGNALVRAGIHEVADLRRFSAAQLAQRLSASPRARQPTRAQIRVWQRRANE